MSHHQQSEWPVLVAGMDRIGSSMRNSKCQELSNPPSSGLGSKDSKSYDEKSIRVRFRPTSHPALRKWASLVWNDEYGLVAFIQGCSVLARVRHGTAFKHV